MVCRSTPGNSGITSLARHNSGLLDVQVLSMFHEVRASMPRNMPGPSAAEVHGFQESADTRARRATGLPDRERNMIVDRIRRANTNMPDGRTYYAWQNIEAATQRAAAAMNTHFVQLANEYGGSEQTYRDAFNQMMRRDHRINGEVPRAPEHVDYFTDNVPRDRGTRYALAMLHAGAARALRRGDTDELDRIYSGVHARSAVIAANPESNPANNCPDCGQFAAADHTCTHDQSLAESQLAYAGQGVGVPYGMQVLEEGRYSYAPLDYPNLRNNLESVQQTLGGQYRASDGTMFERRTRAVQHQRGLDRLAVVQNAIRHAVPSGDGSRAHMALDDATRMVGSVNVTRGGWNTTDGRHFITHADAIYHQFNINRTPEGSAVVGLHPNGITVGTGPLSCDDCGQYVPADGSHACEQQGQSAQDIVDRIWISADTVLDGGNADLTPNEASPSPIGAGLPPEDALPAWERELFEDDARQAHMSEAATPETAVPAQAAAPVRAPARAPARTRNPLRTYRTDDGGSVRLMNVSALRSELRTMEPGEQGTLADITVATVNPDTTGTQTRYEVSGSVEVTNTGLRRTRNRDRVIVTAGERSLRCGCPQYRETYDCEHVREAVERVQALLNDRDPVAVAPAQAMQTVSADLRGEYDASLAAAQQARDAFDDGNDGVSYSESMAAFQTTWDEAKAHFESGETALPYMIENATNGLGAREGGRSFGLEIEIDFPSDMSYTAKNQVAREIYEAGLSDSPEVRPWHWRARQTGPRGQSFGGGYTDNPNMWSVEFDRSVDDVGGQRGCELVSPILYDTPQTWRNLQTILDIVERNGGKATPRTGLHVNVGARDYDHTVEHHNRLIGLANAYEDVIVRTSHNPQSGRAHRGREFCRPMTMPSNGYANIRAAQRGIDPRSHDGSSHRAMINLDHVPAENGQIQTSTRVEVRIFDGSTDPGRIQMATKMALGLVNAAVRGTDAPDEVERAGTHRARNTAANGRARRLRGEEWENDTRSFRQMADTIFTREEDKKQFTYAFAASRWQTAG